MSVCLRSVDDFAELGAVVVLDFLERDNVRAAGLVDELCLTISPMLVGGAGATSQGLLDGAPFAVPSGLRLDQVSTHQGFLFCRYLIA